MLTLDDEQYEVAYGTRRIMLAEDAVGKSTLQVFDGMPTLSELVAFLGYGLRRAGADAWLSPKQGRETALAIVDALGIKACCEEVAEAINRDCGFFFR